MSSALKINQNRPLGETFRLKFPQRPTCPQCGKAMVIRHSSKPKTLIDLQENIQIIICYYQCNKTDCPGKDKPYLKPPNPYAPLNSDYTYLVNAKICQYRWQRRRTYDEICQDMQSDYNIQISRTTVENALKIYEIGCSTKYLPYYKNQILANGGIIITIDGMAPMKGNKSLYVAYDYYTGLTLAAQRVQNQKAETIEEFLKSIKTKIENELSVPVVGIISDALPSQRIAIERVFPKIPHCLCHFHFYKLILIEARNTDSHIITSIRKNLRNSTILKKYRDNSIDFQQYSGYTQILQELVKGLNVLSNWKRKPKDPCFSSVMLFSRIQDIYNHLCANIDIQISEEPIKRIRCPFAQIYHILNKIIDENQETIRELVQIQEYLEELSGILSDLDSSFEKGLSKLRTFRTRLRKHRLVKSCGELERNFIEELMKYVRTKGEMLLNYKRVKDAPTTNNKHELKYKQLKHLIRRVIGFATAKYYLLSHGERIVFIKPDEKFENIIQILRNTDFTEARRIIDAERNPRNSLPNIVHYDDRWAKKMSQLKNMFAQITNPLTIII